MMWWRSVVLPMTAVLPVARAIFLLLVTAAVGCSAAQAAPDTSSAAEGIFAAAPPRLLQFAPWSPSRTAVLDRLGVPGLGRRPRDHQLSRGFAGGARAEDLSARICGGGRQPRRCSLLGIDLPNDLAIVSLDKHDAPFFDFDEAALAGTCPKANASIPWAIRSISALPSSKASITAWSDAATTSASTSPARSIPA